VLAYQRRGIVPFSTPGHKLGLGADEELLEAFGERAFLSDIPLGGGVGDTHFGGNALGIAETLAADAWDADRSFFCSTARPREIRLSCWPRYARETK
jgi:lysine decarboxylase